MDCGPGGVFREVDGHLFADGLAIECGGALVGDFEGLVGGAAGCAAVLLGLEHLDDLGAALFGPGLGVAYGLAVVEDERVGEGVGADLGFVVVDGDSGDGFGVGRGRGGRCGRGGLGMRGERGGG